MPIACLGVFGLFSHTIEQRTKEPGIRKVSISTLVIAVIMVGCKTVKAANANPVDSLRYE